MWYNIVLLQDNTKRFMKKLAFVIHLFLVDSINYTSKNVSILRKMCIFAMQKRK